MIFNLSSISAVIVIVAFLSWFGSDVCFAGKQLYLRKGVWKLLRWIGVLLVLYGLFFYGDRNTINYPTLIGSAAMLFGSARARHPPAGSKPIFQLGDISPSNSKSVD